jgi:hypothetical protein
VLVPGSLDGPGAWRHLLGFPGIVACPPWWQGELCSSPPSCHTHHLAPTTTRGSRDRPAITRTPEDGLAQQLQVVSSVCILSPLARKHVAYTWVLSNWRRQQSRQRQPTNGWKSHSCGEGSISGKLKRKTHIKTGDQQSGCQRWAIPSFKL